MLEMDDVTRLWFLFTLRQVISALSATSAMKTVSNHHRCFSVRSAATGFITDVKGSQVSFAHKVFSSVSFLFTVCWISCFLRLLKVDPHPLHPSYCCNASISYKGEYSYFNKATISNNDITLQTTNPCEKKALVSGSKGLIWDFSNPKSGYRDRE